MSQEWTQVDASGWTFAGVEQQGRHAHNWYRHESEARLWLFKPSRPERHRAIGEEITEKVASEIAALLGVPAARVELATRDGVPGVLIEDARPSQWALQHGAALMGEVVDDYDPGDRQHHGHEPGAIQQALRRFSAPPAGGLPDSFTAFDAFVGFLIFDALIAHVDRHDRNWAVLIPPPGVHDDEALCASFDHAASLCSTLTARECSTHLVNKTVDRWARGGKAATFEHRRGTRWRTLVELAGTACRLCSVDVRTYWHHRVTSLDEGAMTDLLGGAPMLDGDTRRFIIELVLVNRRRLLDELG